jgi:RNA polymerase sigma-70 factor (ECF subfamily)
VRPDRGRFRAFLLTALRHFLANERDWRHAVKRGGGKPSLSLSSTTASVGTSGADRQRDAERIYERR